MLFRRKTPKVELGKPISVEQLINKARNPNTGWGGLYYGNISAIANLISANQIIEVGVAYGGHAHFILSNSSTIKYLGVDPYVFNYDPNDAFCSDVERYLGLKGQLAMDVLFSGVQDSLNVYGGRSKILRLDSIKFAEMIPDESESLVFLDNNHTYNHVTAEIASWWPKIKEKGVLAGDDYWMKDVSSAVNDFVSKHSLELMFVSKNDYKTWFIQKL